MNKDGLEDKSLLISNITRAHYRPLRRNGSEDVHTATWTFERLSVKTCGLLGCCIRILL